MHELFLIASTLDNLASPKEFSTSSSRYRNNAQCDYEERSAIG
jgi:hypothetical protein